MIEPVDPSMLPPSRLHSAGDQEAVASAESPTESSEGTGFQVQLDRVFFGPLDLLLQLVRDKELEIHVVALADVCDAYCRYIRSLAKVDVDEAADYLVLAATLLAIKSRSLLPQDEVEVDEDPFDPARSWFSNSWHTRSCAGLLTTCATTGIVATACCRPVVAG